MKAFVKMAWSSWKSSKLTSKEWTENGSKVTSAVVLSFLFISNFPIHIQLYS